MIREIENIRRAQVLKAAVSRALERRKAHGFDPRCRLTPRAAKMLAASNAWDRPAPVLKG